MTALPERAEQWAARRRVRVAGLNPLLLAVRTVRAVIDDRVPGLAAEMAFFALLSLVPLVAAIGAALGYLERLVGSTQVARAEQTVLEGLEAVFSPELTNDLLRPAVSELLHSERGGIALTSLAVTLWLASRVFSATIRALDLAFNVEERRNIFLLRLEALVFALISVVVIAVSVTVLVVGPLLGGGQALAERLDLGDSFRVAWQIGRWPVMLAVAVGFLTVVYRLGPNLRLPWRWCLPGAVFGVGLWVLLSAGFRLYLEVGATSRLEQDAATTAVVAVLGVIVSVMLWIFLSGMAMLIGGELNAELAKLRGWTPPTRA